eukprot:s203_g27.t1
MCNWAHLDAKINEVLLIHGTTQDKVDQIANFGFDERLARENGLYGQGVYFTDQSCKSFQYSGAKKQNAGCLIIARVILGHPCEAQGPMRNLKVEPPIDENNPSKGRCHSVIARPGIPNGWGEQVHREFGQLIAPFLWPAALQLGATFAKEHLTLKRYQNSLQLMQHMQLDVSYVGTRRCLGPGAIAKRCGFCGRLTGSFTREARGSRLHLAFGAAALALSKLPRASQPLPELPPLPPFPGQNVENGQEDGQDDQDLSDEMEMDDEYEDQSLDTSPSLPLPPFFAGRARAEAREDATDNGYDSYNGYDGYDDMGDVQLKGVESRPKAVQVKLLGPTAKAFVQDSSRREKSREFYMLQPEDDGPRPLSWEEARIDFLPVGETVRGVVEEIRPYGSFIGLVVCGMAVGRFGEDSQIRGFCEELQLTDGWVSPQVGQQVAVKILSIDEMKRVHLSISQATPPWPPREERVLHSPEKYEDSDFFPLP